SHRVGLESLRAQERGGSLARVTMSADHRDWVARVQPEGLEVPQFVHLGGGEGAEVERRPEAYGALRHSLCGADIEQLHAVAALEALGELLGRDLRNGSARHADECRWGVRKCNRHRGFPG